MLHATSHAAILDMTLDAARRVISNQRETLVASDVEKGAIEIRPASSMSTNIGIAPMTAETCGGMLNGHVSAVDSQSLTAKERRGLTVHIVAEEGWRSMS